MIVTPLVFWSFVAPFFATALRFPVGVKKVPGKSSGFLMYKTDIGSHVDLYEQPAGHNYVITLDGTPEDLEEGDFIVSLNGPNDEGNLGFMNIRGKGKWKVEVFIPRDMITGPRTVEDFTDQSVSYNYPDVTTHKLAVKQSLLQKIGIM